jgi:hypothetical protein
VKPNSLPMARSNITFSRTAYVERGLREWRIKQYGPLAGSGLASTPATPAAPASSSLASVSASRDPVMADNPGQSQPADRSMRKRSFLEATAEERQAASAGRLVEVDLGPEARMENIRRTEEALNRLRAGSAAAPARSSTTAASSMYSLFPLFAW